MQERVLIQAAFEAQARRRPDALAISASDCQLTYGALDAAADYAASRIGSSEAPTGGVVAILAERGPKLVVAMLACLKAGRPFMVLDLAYPKSRLETLADICRPSLVLLAGDADRGPDLAAPRLAIDFHPAATAGTQPLAERGTSADAPAYLLFTSGSTGVPKCVACSHRPLVNFVGWQAGAFGLGEADRFTLLSGLSHDPVLRDVFTPLSLGASLHIPDQPTLTAPGGLRAWFQEVQPTVAHMTPPLGLLLTAGRAAGERLDSLRHVFWGGDVLRQSLVDALAELAPGCESVNFYGSTETPQAAAFYRASAGAGLERVPIGVGVDGFEVIVQDEHARPAAPGQLGEIVIRSRFLTLGYVEAGRLQAPSSEPSQAVYATGDLGRRREDGQVLVEGRRDDQVKVRGYRVEMPEITACALQTPGVGEAITLNLGDRDRVELCCFVAAHGEWAAGLQEDVRAALARRLPVYMVPDRIIEVEHLPLLPNGKVDRQTLLARERLPQETTPPSSLPPVEAALAAQWRSIFRQTPVTSASSFAALGGDSLSYVNAYLALEEVLGAVPEGWTTMTVAELARTCTTQTAGAGRSIVAKVESAILLRALAIGAVVASHFGLLLTGGGATSALIWVSGFLFGGLQMHEAEHQASVRPVLRVLRSVLIPLAVYEAPQLIVKALTHHHFHWSSVFLFVDLLDYTGAAPSGPDAYGGHEFVMWYIHCIVHILVLYAVLFALFRYALKLRRPTVATVVAAVALGLFGRFLMPVLIDPGFWSAPVQPMSFFNHAPTTHLATFALAALAGYLRGRGRLAVMALAAAYAALSLPLFGPIDSIAIGVVAAMLLFVPQLPVPRVLTRAIYSVAGASFFIYLLHLKMFMFLAAKLHLPPLAIWPVAMFGGVVAWSAWNWTAPRAGSWVAAIRLRAPRAVSTAAAEPA